MLFVSILKSLKTLIPLLTKFRRFSFRERRDFAIRDQFNSLSPIHKEIISEFDHNIQERLIIQNEILFLLQDSLNKVTLLQEELENPSLNEHLSNTEQGIKVINHPIIVSAQPLSTERLLTLSRLNATIKAEKLDEISIQTSKFLKNESNSIEKHLSNSIYKKFLFGV